MTSFNGDQTQPRAEHYTSQKYCNVTDSAGHVYNVTCASLGAGDVITQRPSGRDRNHRDDTEMKYGLVPAFLIGAASVILLYIVFHCLYVQCYKRKQRRGVNGTNTSLCPDGGSAVRPPSSKYMIPAIKYSNLHEQVETDQSITSRHAGSTHNTQLQSEANSYLPHQTNYNPPESPSFQPTVYVQKGEARTPDPRLTSASRRSPEGQEMTQFPERRLDVHPSRDLTRNCSPHSVPPEVSHIGYSPASSAHDIKQATLHTEAVVHN